MIDVTPRGDLIEHESGPDCACGPDELTARLADSGLVIDRIHVHHSLDGREQFEL